MISKKISNKKNIDLFCNIIRKYGGNVINVKDNFKLKLFEKTSDDFDVNGYWRHSIHGNRHWVSSHIKDMTTTDCESVKDGYIIDYNREYKKRNWG